MRSTESSIAWMRASRSCAAPVTSFLVRFTVSTSPSSRRATSVGVTAAAGSRMVSVAVPTSVSVAAFSARSSTRPSASSVSRTMASAATRGSSTAIATSPVWMT